MKTQLKHLLATIRTNTAITPNISKGTVYLNFPMVNSGIFVSIKLYTPKATDYNDCLDNADIIVGVKAHRRLDMELWNQLVSVRTFVSEYLLTTGVTSYDYSTIAHNASEYDIKIDSELPTKLKSYFQESFGFEAVL